MPPRGRGGRGRGRGRGGRGGAGDEDGGGSGSDTDKKNEQGGEGAEGENKAEQQAAAKALSAQIAANALKATLNPMLFDVETGKRRESGATVTVTPPKYQRGARDIAVSGVDIHFKGHTILESATFTLSVAAHHRVGLVGQNGCGKSTFLKVLAVGEIPFPPGTDWYFVEREVPASKEITALQAVVSADAEKTRLERELEELQEMPQDDETVISRMDEVYERLDELGAESAEARAGKILFGLGFSTEMMTRPTASFSGGWRMRIALAQALFINPSLLLLDGPTNHLDIDAVCWLEAYLCKFRGALLMVSHSQDFMNNVCTRIMHMQNGKLTNYNGDYDTYCMARAEKDENQNKRYQWQQAQIKHMKEYIARFGHGSAKLARQAQSKEKTMSKMVRSGLETEASEDAQVKFRFGQCGYLAPPVIQFTDVEFGYPGCAQLLKGINCGIDMDSRICICGPNGAGKTTFTKLVTRELDPTSGYVAKNAHCMIARYHQHFADEVDQELSPLQWLRTKFPEVLDPSPLRGALGRMGISGRAGTNPQLAPFKTLSDGQKARVVFAYLSMLKAHILILDEPTNGLDQDSIDALSVAVTNFDGAVLAISHDASFISQGFEEIWDVDNGKVTVFPGDINDYKEMIKKKVAARSAAYAKATKAAAAAPLAAAGVAAGSKVVMVPAKK